MSESGVGKTLIIGAGPAGLVAGLELSKNNHPSIIIESQAQVGGISRTIKHNDNFYDFGPHRFFTKETVVKDLWHDTLGSDFLKCPRLTRIYFNNKFFYYPLKALNAFFGLGVISSISIFLSYLVARLKYYLNPKKEVKNFEEWVSQRFGKKLFNIFFKTYTEKVWGISTSKIGADWAAQRIKGLSLFKAVKDAIFTPKQKLTTLIDEFNYPRLGAGMMYEKIAENYQARGGELKLNSKITEIIHEDSIIKSVKSNDGIVYKADNLISSMPLTNFVKSLSPKAPQEIIEAADSLRFRTMVIVYLTIDKEDIFPDNWIYIHSPEVKVGRITNFKNWSKDMISNQLKTTLAMEYFCFESDEVWKMDQEAIVNFAKEELEKMNLAKKEKITESFSYKMKYVYPVYDLEYKNYLNKILNYLKNFSNLQLVGRNGIFRYNNMDHSVLTGLYAARNILGESHDIFSINTDDDYHEIKKEKK